MMIELWHHYRRPLSADAVVLCEAVAWGLGVVLALGYEDRRLFRSIYWTLNPGVRKAQSIIQFLYSLMISKAVYCGRELRTLNSSSLYFLYTKIFRIIFVPFIKMSTILIERQLPYRINAPMI